MFKKPLVSLIVLTLILLPLAKVVAMTVDELRAQIDAKQKEKAALEAENIRLQKQIDETNGQANTLQTAVSALDSTQKKLQNDILVTQNKINTLSLDIEKLGIEIGNTEDQISNNKQAMAEALRILYQSDSASFIQNLLQYDNISEVWDAIETLHRFQTTVEQRTNELAKLNATLASQKTESEGNKKDLTSSKVELSDRKKIVDQNKQAKAVLLAQTKSKEAEYQKQLADNIEKGKKFEQELFQFESQLKAQIDESKLPSEKQGVLGWPLDDVYITQRFGQTVDSKRLYVSGSHNGVDFRASVGTQVKSAEDGTIMGMGNTDDQKGCYSYGRWLLIKYGNGLTSIYAHLSGIKVSVGESVTRGEVVGYSGGQPGTSGAGYSTGPHLHMGLFASDGVRIEKYSASNFCKQVSIPIAQGLNAYLDPLAYLPPLN